MKSNDKKKVVGLIVTQELLCTVTINEPITPKVIHIRIELENIKLDLILIYSPVEDKEERKLKSSIIRYKLETTR